MSTNYPLTIGDEVWADDGSQGEIHVGRSTVVRLGPRTAFSFLNLDDDTTQMRVTEGSLALTVNRLDDDEVIEVDTPNAAITVLRPGFYRVDVDEQRYETRITVRQGEAEVVAGGGAVSVRSSESLLVNGDESDSRYDMRDAYARDSWEEWGMERDRREERFESRRYVSQGMVGYEDLDEYGRWRDDSQYGRVWQPLNVAADWAPYRNGHWAWVQPWGWTWIDDAPWGFAPFHYGRWAQRDQSWLWVPGSLVARPLYAPALVAFIDDDDWFRSLAMGAGGLGWFPLGPSEVYIPPYPVSPGYLRNVNVAYVPNIAQINVPNINLSNVRYVNQDIPGAVTVVSRDAFVGGRPVGKAAVVVQTKGVRAKVRPTVVQSLKPRRESILGATTARVAVRRPPAGVLQRPVVARMSPPPTPPRLVDEGRVAPASPPQVRPAIREGKATLRPMREGIPAPRAVRAGERARARGPEGPRDRPSQPAVEQPQRERPKAREPEVPKPPAAEKERVDQRNRSREQPPSSASPAPVGQPPREPAKPQDRARDQRERAQEPPPVVRPEAPKPPTGEPKERAHQTDRSRERPSPAAPAPVVQPSEPAKPQDNQRDRRERAREQPPAVQPEAPKPAAVSPTPVEQPTEPAKPQDRARDQRSRDRVKEKEKPKAKPTPTPTPTAEPG